MKTAAEFNEMYPIRTAPFLKHFDTRLDYELGQDVLLHGLHWHVIGVEPRGTRTYPHMTFHLKRVTIEQNENPCNVMER